MTYVSHFGTKGTGDGQFESPRAITINSTDYIYVVDSGHNRIQIFDPSGKFLSQFGTKGTGDGQFSTPQGIAINSTGYVYVTDRNNGRIQVFDSMGTFTSKFKGTTGDRQSTLPFGIAINSTGYIYVTTESYNAVLIFDPSGNVIGKFGGSGSINQDGRFDDPRHIALNSTGAVYVIDAGHNRTQIFDPSGKFLDKFEGFDTTGGRFSNPIGIAFDSTGSIYVVDTGNSRIYMNNDAYSFRVQDPQTGTLTVNIPAGSVQDKGGSGNTASNTITLNILGVLGMPTDFTVEHGNTQVTLSWTAPATNGGSAITDYKIEYSTDGTLWTTFTDGTATTTSTIVTGLTNGQAYQFRVSAINAEGQGPVSDTTSATPATIPTAPTGLIATSEFGTPDSGYITLSWVAPNNGGSAITDYKIEYSSDSGTTWSTFDDGISPQAFVPIEGLTNGVQYQFRVSAINAEGPSSVSDTISATPTSKPAAPASLSATPGNSQVTLSWTAPNNGGSAITDYKIEYSINGNTWTTVNDGTATTTTVTVTGLTNGQAYQFRVSTINAIGESDTHATVSATPVTTPTAPTGLNPTPGNSQVTLSWTAPTNNGGSAITDYKIEYSANAGTSWNTFTDGTSTDTTVIITGLTNGVQYQFRVSAITTIGIGTASSITDATPAIPPTAPTGLNPTPGNSQVTLSWTAPTNNGGSAITGYTIQHKASTESWPGTSDTIGNLTSHIITGLTNGEQYDFRIYAINLVGTGIASGTVSATPVSTPGAPTSLSATPGNARITLSWTAPTNNGGSAITDYKIEYSSNAGTSWSTFDDGVFNKTSTIVTGITNGQAYQFRVSAINAIGSGATSDSLDYTIPDTIDTASPSVRLSTTVSGSTTLSSIPFFIKFSENVTGFEISDISVSSGTVQNFISPFQGYFSSRIDNSFNRAFDITVNSTGHIFVTDINQHRIMIFDSSGNHLNSFGSAGSRDGQFNTPNGITVNSTGHIFVLDSHNDRIQIFDPSGNYLAQFGEYGNEDGQFDSWNGGIITNSTDHLFITDSFNSRIQIFDPSGNYLAQISTPNNQEPRGKVAINSTGHIFASDNYNHRILIFNSSGNHLNSFGSGGSGDGQFDRPTGIAINDTDYIYVTDAGNNRIQIFDPSGTYISQFNGTLTSDFFGTILNSIAIGPAGGVYVTDANNYRIYVERNAHYFTVTNPSSGTLTVNIPVGSAQDMAGNDNIASNTISLTVSTSLNPTSITVPAAPTSLSATPGNSQVSLSWTAPATNGGSPITDYKIEYSTDGTLWNTFTDGTSTSTTVIVTGLTNGVQYQFRVSAVNTAGTGTASSTTDATPRTVPAAPTSLSATPGNAQVSLSWFAPTNNGGSTITDYKIEYSSNAGTSWNTFTDGTSTGTTVTVTGLSNGQAYQFRVSAVNTAGTGAASSTVDATPRTVPAAPTGLSATPGDAQIVLSWTAPNNGGSAITEYTIQYKASTASWPGVTTTVVNVVSHTISSLTNGVQYDFRISAENLAGTGPVSSIVSTTPVASNVPDTVPPVITTPADAIIVHQNDAFTVTDALVGVTCTDTEDSNPTLTSDITNVDTAIVGSYTVTYSCTDASSNSAVQQTRAVTVIGTPAAPTGLSATPSNTQITLSWTAPNNGGSPITGYTIQHKASTESWPGTSTVIGNLTSTTITGLTNNIQYDFRVNATNDAGTSTSSGIVSATPIASIIPDTILPVVETPSAPTGLTATPGNEQVSLTWNVPVTHGTTITDYIIERNSGSLWVTVSDGISTDTFTTVTGITNEITYQFRVSAVNNIGTGPVSDIVTTTPNAEPAAPGIPTGLTATAGNTQVLLSWTAPDSNRSPITDYTIQYKLNTATSWTTFNDGTVNQTSTIVTGLTNGVPYQFRVSATNSIGTGLFSTPIDFIISSTVDTVPPSVVLSTISPDPTSLSSILFTIQFNENITGFEASDVTVSSGTVTNLIDSFSGFFGELGGNEGQLNSPHGITVNATGHIFVLEDSNNRIQILEIIDGEIRHAANFDIPPFDSPQRMAMNSTGHIFVTDKRSHGIHVIDPAGNYLTKLGTKGPGDDQFDEPLGITINGTDHIFVADTFNSRIKILDSSGKYLDQIDDNSTGDGRLDGARDIAINSTGHVFVTDFVNERVQIFNSMGHLVGSFGTAGSGDGQFNDPMGIAINGTDHIYVADQKNNRVQIFDSAGKYQGQFNGQGSGDNTLRWPTSIALDSMGGVYVTSLTSFQIYVERDMHSFEVQNPVNGRLTVTIPAGSVQDTAGNSNTASNTVSLTVTGSSVVQPTVTAPGAPTSLTATAGNGIVTLSWSAPDNQLTHQ